VACTTGVPRSRRELAVAWLLSRLLATVQAAAAGAAGAGAGDLID